MGKIDEALTQQERSYEMHEISTIAYKVLPELDPVRNEERFKVVLKKLNLD